MCENTFKIIVVGDEKSGKTSFMKRHICNIFLEEHVPTLGNEIYSVNIKYRKNYNFVFWDLAGKEEYRGLYDGYMIGTNACIIMFDINNFEVKKIIKTVRDVKRVNDNFICILVANKLDLLTTYDKKIHKRLDYLKKRIKDIHKDYSYCEISCKNKNNIDIPFNILVSSLIESKIVIKTYHHNNRKIIIGEHDYIRPISNDMKSVIFE